MKYRQRLDDVLGLDRKAIEASEVQVSGYSGGSPEGEIWQYAFASWWTCEPEIASVTVRINWMEGYDEECAKKIAIQTIAEVFRRGGPSRIRETWAKELSVDEFAALGLLSTIEREMKIGMEKLSAYNMPLNSDKRQKPLAV